MEEELLNAILHERSTPQLLGPEISAKLSEVAKRYWGKESRNSALIKKLQEDHRIPQNCEDIRVPLLNEDILNNKNLHYFYRRCDKRLTVLQGLVVSASASILNLANSCINADKHNKVVDSKVVVANAIDALTLLGTAHSHISVE